MFGLFKKEEPRTIKPAAKKVVPNSRPPQGARPASAKPATTAAPVTRATASHPPLDSLTKEQVSSLRGGEFPSPSIFGSAYLLANVGDKYFEFSASAFPADNQRTAYMQYRSEVLGAGVMPIKVPAEAADIRAVMEKFDGSVNQDADAPIEEAKAIFREIIATAIKEKVSDVHFIVRKDSAIVLFRIWGEITKSKQYEPKSLAGVLSAVYNKMHDARSNSDASFSAIMPSYCTVSLPELAIKLRWQTVPLGYDDNFDVVCRLISKNNGKPMSLDQLGYLPSQAQLLEMAARTPKGGIFVAGVTGSGKSKTLQSLMWIVAQDGTKKNYTVEDPIEYPMFGVSQTMVQRNESTDGNPFAKAMKTFMRADPDTIMAGEIRDTDSAQVAEDIVRSGHHLLTTIHAASAMAIIGRLASRDIGMSRDTLAEPDFLSALVYQHLVPVLCKHCKVPFYELDETRNDERLAAHLFGENRYALDPGSVYVRSKDGCPHCVKGVSGLTVCAEVITPGKDYEMLRAFKEARIADALMTYRSRRHARFDEPDCDGKLAHEVGLYKVSQGILDPRDVQSLFGDFGLMDIY